MNIDKYCFNPISKDLYCFKFKLKINKQDKNFEAYDHMKFHEDIIFKNEGQNFGQELIEIINIKGKILKVHQTEYSIIDPKMYKPDMVFELEDKIIILEFQSSYVNISDKRRFRFYSALFDNIKNKSKKPIEVHVLSTIENEKTKCYRINPESRFPIYIHSLKNYNSDEFLNSINVKINDNKDLSKKELLLISLLCFMKSEHSVEHNILNSAETITNIPYLNYELGQFAKGVVLLLCDKFVKEETLNQKISNMVGGNMKIVEDYAKRVAEKEVKKVEKKFEKSKRNVILNLDNEGYGTEDIAKLADVSLEFVNETLSKK